tara:strand:- start:385 stop:1230 length:846 start_codon:yes stop_codon:yes gene_type:complete
MKTIKEIYDILYTVDEYNHSYLPRVKQCKDTDDIPKVDNAGEVIVDGENRYQVMHNGVLIHQGCYHQQWMTDLICEMKGHHEPQEEKLFHEVLKVIPENALMIECGSFWAYYSLWFHKEISGAKNIMIEPNPLKLQLGMHNFKANKFGGDFINAAIHDRGLSKARFKDYTHSVEIPFMSLDWLLENRGIDKVDVLHADVQEAERHLLAGSSDSLRDHKIDFIFLGTHSRNLEMEEYLEGHGYKILESYEVEESYFDDGLILACSPEAYERVDTSLLKVSKR